MISSLRGTFVIVAAAALAPGVAAQTVEEHVAQGVAAGRAHPDIALRHFEAALALDSTDYEANWRAAVALIDIGKQTPDEVSSPERDSLYALAERYARRAVEAKLLGGDGHYALAAAIGRASLTKGKRERVQRARDIRVEALKALELNPEDDRAWHVLGRWHAEIERLSGIQKFFAKNMFGGDFLKLASWDQAVEAMQKAVAFYPESIYHRLDLARIFVDLKRYPEAREQLAVIDTLADVDVQDPTYKVEAHQLATEIADR